MLNQLISDKNKRPFKKVRIDDVCSTMLTDLNKEIKENKGLLVAPPLPKAEHPHALTKGERILKNFQRKKQKNAIYLHMSDQDNKTSKRIHKMFSVQKRQQNNPQQV